MVCLYTGKMAVFNGMSQDSVLLEVRDFGLILLTIDHLDPNMNTYNLTHWDLNLQYLSEHFCC